MDYKTFRCAKRIRVIDPEHIMKGETGSIERLRIGDDGAWVCMDKEPPAELQSFPQGDSRHNNILLYPDQCELT